MFSVVIPLYNKRHYILRCVESVLRQSYKHFELLIVDDGSTDAGIDKLSGIDDERLLIIQQINSGVGEARNTGINKANGQWIAFLDADDMWFPDHLQELYKIIVAYPDAGLISNSSIEINHNTILPAIPASSSKIYQINYFTEASKNIGIINSSSVAVKSSVISSVGGFKGFKSGEDLEFLARVALDYSVAFSTKITAVYYRGTGGVMESHSPENKINKYKQLCLSGISPSVEFLLSKLDDPKYKYKKNFIATYINSRVLSSVRSAIYIGNISEAKTIVLLAITPEGFRLKSMKIIFMFPNIAIHVALFFFRAMKVIKNRTFNRVNN